MNNLRLNCSVLLLLPSTNIGMLTVAVVAPGANVALYWPVQIQKMYVAT